MGLFYDEADSIVGISIPKLSKAEGLEWEASLLHLFKLPQSNPNDPIECKHKY